jgi:homoprotocatechuate degradation regulator HpaR
MNASLRPFTRSLPMALMRARESVMRHFRPKLQAANLTEQQWRTLRALGNGEEMEATRLAVATFLLAPSLTRILRDLEARGLVLRRAGPRDARVALIKLSPEGATLLRELGAHSEQIYSAIEARLGRERLNALMLELSAVAQDLQAPLDL